MERLYKKYHIKFIIIFKLKKKKKVFKGFLIKKIKKKILIIFTGELFIQKIYELKFFC